MKKAKRNAVLPRLAARLSLTVVAQCAGENLPGLKDWQRWCLAALQPGVQQAQVSIVLLDAVEGRTFNQQYRGKDYATNVLSFPLHDESAGGGQPLLGDLVFCVPVVAAEASEQGKTLSAHYAHLVVHGILHLQGFDHEEEGEAEMMEKLESNIVKRLGYADPYLEEQC
ncbi:rRNA maturation RNase YbeY [Neisseriaceae bacterium TC5R-5]|nr:rRNA maturation RNase YbeY [Neisseriaceae bacterium TC5R-5]